MTPTPHTLELDEEEIAKAERLVRSVMRRRKPKTKEEALALGSLIKGVVGYSISVAISKIAK